VLFFPLGVWLPRNGAQASLCEPARSGAAAKRALRWAPRRELIRKSWPSPSVVRFSTEYKIGILEEADSASAIPGGVGALLRREVYSSHLTSWRRERQAGIREALKPRKRGPRSAHNPRAEENEKLRRQVGQLTEKLRKAEIIIDVQKKVAALLGHAIPDAPPGREILMSAVTQLTLDVGTSAACRAPSKCGLVQSSLSGILRPWRLACSGPVMAHAAVRSRRVHCRLDQSSGTCGRNGP